MGAGRVRRSDERARCRPPIAALAWRPPSPAPLGLKLLSAVSLPRTEYGDIIICTKHNNDSLFSFFGENTEGQAIGLRRTQPQRKLVRSSPGTTFLVSAMVFYGRMLLSKGSKGLATGSISSGGADLQVKACQNQKS